MTASRSAPSKLAAKQEEVISDEDKPLISDRVQKGARREVKERKRNPQLKTAIDDIAEGVAALIFRQGHKLLEQNAFAHAFQHFDVCVLKSPYDWLYRLARAQAAFHLNIFALTVSDADLALHFKEEDDRKASSPEFRKQLSPELEKDLSSEARRNRARCAYWQGKGHLARGELLAAREAFLLSEKTFPSEMAKANLSQISKMGLADLPSLAKDCRLQEKRLFFDPIVEDRHFAESISGDPRQALKPYPLARADFVFERADYDEMLCSFIEEFLRTLM